MDLNERQRFVLALLNEHPEANPGWIGEKIQDRFGAKVGNLSASRRFGRSRAGLNTLAALERRGLVRGDWPYRGGSRRWVLTAAGREALNG